jgi:hypothetical protein
VLPCSGEGIRSELGIFKSKLSEFFLPIGFNASSAQNTTAIETQLIASIVEPDAHLLLNTNCNLSGDFNYFPRLLKVLATREKTCFEKVAKGGSTI